MLADEDKIKKINQVVYNSMLAATRVMHPEKVIKIPDTIWHYTNASSIEAILKSKSIYATQFDYLNDPSENRLFGKISQIIAKERLQDLPKLKLDDQIQSMDQFKATWWNIINDIDEFFVFQPSFVTSFSESSDLLGQWRAYADNCNGYALGLSSKWLIDQTVSESSHLRLLRVIYHSEIQYELVSKLLDTAIDSIASILSEVPEEDLSEAIDWIVTILRRLVAEFSPVIKHPAYSDEREWRILSIGEPRNVRVVKGNFVQYKIINLNVDNRHPFREIKLGPGNNPIIEQNSVKLLLNNLGLATEVKISKSNIPIRI
jgi:hypothetical protein